MDVLKIEKVVVGSDVRSTSAEIKSEPYQHDSLQCYQCFITFSDFKAKERHMRKSHREQYKRQLQQANTVFTCYKCDKSFLSSEELSQHQASHTTDEKPFCCPYCQQSFFTFTELTRHRRHACAERQCPCRDCGAWFPSPSRLRNHRIAVHPQLPVVADDVNTYQCCKCGHGFQVEEELVQHQERFASNLNCGAKPTAKKRGRKPKYAVQWDSKKIKQEEGVGGSADSVTEGPTPDEAQPELKIPCPEADCDLIFPSVAALRAHRRGSHGRSPPHHKTHSSTERDESDAQPEQPIAHATGAPRSGCSCPTFAESFAEESVLRVHQETHLEGKEAANKR